MRLPGSLRGTFPQRYKGFETMYHGIINIYKEPGYTSHDVVARLRGILKQKKITKKMEYGLLILIHINFIEKSMIF